MKPSGISSNNIEPRAAEIITKLNIPGFDAYLVGGCVRDLLLGKTPKDWDVATSALPEEVVSVFSDNHIIETGIKHGTVTIVSNGLPIEVTTFRVDGNYEDGRRPANVIFVRNIREDLARRDFTINAIAYHPDKGLIDPFGGVTDLNTKTVHAVGDANTRLNEDGLRILRALRFASTLSFEIDSSLASSIHHNKKLLQNISVERIATEMTKLLCGDNVSKILIEYSDIFSVFIPEISDIIGFDQRSPYHLFDAWTHTVLTVAAAPTDPILRLTMLFHDLGKPACFTQDDDEMGHFYGHEDKSAEIANRRLRELRFDNETIDAVCELVRWHDVGLTEKNLIKWLNRLGEPRLRQLFEIKLADAKSHSAENATEKLSELWDREMQLNDILEKEVCFSLKDLSLNGDDLLAAGIPEGAEIGFILQRLLDAVMDGRLPNEKQALLRAAIPAE